MSNTGRQWFAIASVFSEIKALCQAARQAEELAAQQEKAAAEAAKAGAGAPGARAEKAPSRVDVIGLRKKLRTRLDELKTELAKTLTEREVYYVLFPLVVYTDEQLQGITRGRAIALPPLRRELSDEPTPFASSERESGWRSLQSELYEVEDGGEAFYTWIDHLLKREETSPLIFEVFYLCLSDGFVGRYKGFPEKIDEYKKQLMGRIPPVSRLEERADKGQEEAVELVEFPKWYYVIAAASVVGMFAVLHLLSAFEAFHPG
jgi:type VI protein secretion system component VasF